MFATVNTAMYYTNFEGLYAAWEALDDLLDNWDAPVGGGGAA